jgi:hypothetical protein
MPGIAQPNVALEQAAPLRGKKAHFRLKLTGLFHPVIEIGCDLSIKEDDQLRSGGAVLGSAKAKDINAGLPGNFFRRTLDRCHRIGEPRAVHVDEKVVRPSELSDADDFINGIHRSEFSRLGHTDHARLRRVQRRLLPDQVLGESQINFTVTTIHQKELGSFAKKFRRAAFIGLDMSVAVTKDAVERLAKLGQRDRICGGAIRGEKDGAIGLEQLVDVTAGASRPFIIAIRWGRVMVRTFERRENLRTNSGGVVTGELMPVWQTLHSASVPVFQRAAKWNLEEDCLTTEPRGLKGRQANHSSCS